jgi:Fe2+ transport system protein FeoA
MLVNLVEMKPGKSGVISSVQGGPGFVEKLSHIGLHEGKVIKKISSVFSLGPVAICVDNFQVAVGYGKAIRIMVEVNDDEKTCHGRES